MTSYLQAFDLFWDQVKLSIDQGRFAKLTMAKTIGKPELKNIFVRPIYSDTGFMAMVKMHYAAKETEDQESELTLNQTLEVVKAHLKTSFFTVVLFTTTQDITFKINKKGAGSMVESEPTFHNIIQAK